MCDVYREGEEVENGLRCPQPGCTGKMQVPARSEFICFRSREPCLFQELRVQGSGVGAEGPGFRVHLSRRTSVPRGGRSRQRAPLPPARLHRQDAGPFNATATYHGKHGEEMYYGDHGAERREREKRERERGPALPLAYLHRQDTGPFNPQLSALHR